MVQLLNPAAPAVRSISHSHFLSVKHLDIALAAFARFLPGFTKVANTGMVVEKGSSAQ